VQEEMSAMQKKEVDFASDDGKSQCPNQDAPEIMHKVLQRYHGDRLKELEAKIAELLNHLHAFDGVFQYGRVK
jgi:hypothetical protein